MAQAKGTFDVKRSVEPGCDLGDGEVAGHFRFDKTFTGPLEATSVVHMLAVGSPQNGSAGYVAVERIKGSLDGRSGTFFCQHFGVMDRGEASLTLTVTTASAVLPRGSETV